MTFLYAEDPVEPEISDEALCELHALDDAGLANGSDEEVGREDSSPSRADITLDKMPALFSKCRESFLQFKDFLDGRETLKENLEKKLSDPYIGLTAEMREVFAKYQAHNVSRADDPATKRFSALVQLEVLHKDTRGISLAVLNLTLWRCLAGTPAFALLVGWMGDWTVIEKSTVVHAIEFVMSKGLIEYFFTSAYSAPRALRNVLMRCDKARRNLFLYTPAAVKSLRPKLYQSLTVPGRLEQISAMWNLSPDFATAAAQNTREALCSALAKAPFFGTDRGNGFREPGFFSKEIFEDLLLIGIPSVCVDKDDWVVAGCGAIVGLEFLFGLEHICQGEALIAMRYLLAELRKDWNHERMLELHDVQFMLCQYGRLRKGTMRQRVKPDGTARLVEECMQKAFDAIDKGHSFAYASGLFRGLLAELPDVV